MRLINISGSFAVPASVASDIRNGRFRIETIRPGKLRIVTDNRSSCGIIEVSVQDAGHRAKSELNESNKRVKRLTDSNATLKKERDLANRRAGQLKVIAEKARNRNANQASSNPLSE